MSFMFHPYPYVDHDAVNEVVVPGVSPVRGIIAVARRIAALLSEGKNIGIDAYPGADTAALGDAICSQLGLIQQSTYLFNRSLFANLSLGDRSITRDAAAAALQAVGLGPLLASLPKGLDTMVSEAGHNFSGGERHRIALARVLLKDTPVVLLDEPTVALDPLTEHALLEDVFKVLEGRSVVMVTHHLAGIERMDRVVFIEDGRIALEGSPAELARSSARFQQLLAFDREL